MTDREFAKTRARIKRAFNRWYTCLGFKWWRDVTMCYHRDPQAMCQATHRDSIEDGQLQVAAVTFVKWEYLDVAIHWNCQRIFGVDDSDLDYIMRHEFAHALVNQMREWRKCPDHANSHEEQVCTRLAQIFSWVRTAGEDDASRRRKRRTRK